MVGMWNTILTQSNKKILQYRLRDQLLCYIFYVLHKRCHVQNVIAIFEKT
jgi:hypothetical protein